MPEVDLGGTATGRAVALNLLALESGDLSQCMVPHPVRPGRTRAAVLAFNFGRRFVDAEAEMRENNVESGGTSP